MTREKVPPPIKRFQKWLDKFEKKEPNWLQLAILWIFTGALQSLRAFIEDPNESEINWANPWAELQWGAEWDWDSMHILSYTFTDESLRDHEALANQIVKGAVNHISLYALHLLTRKVALLKQGEDFSYLLPQDITKTINEMAENDREAYLAKLYEPLSIGAIEVPGELPEDGPVPDEVAAQMQEKLADLPSLAIKGEAGGVPFEANLVFQFHPLVVDADERRAYYPIICGIVFDPIDGNTPPGDLWELIFTSIDETVEGLTTWRPKREAGPPISDIALPEMQGGGRLLTVLSVKHYRELQNAISKKAFLPMQGTPWPTAALATGRDYAQLIPPPFDDQLLPPEEAKQWADLMFKQQKELSDLDVDALDALNSIWLSQAKKPQDDAVTDIDHLLKMRGLVPKHKQGRAFRKHQRQEMLRALTHIQNLWLNMAEVETYSGTGKKIREAIQSRAFVITDRMGQMRLDGFMDVQRFVFRPGSVFAAFLFGPGRQVALLSSKALEYNPYSQKPEKRLARYLSWHWRTQARTGKFIMIYRVETLLDAAGDKINERKPNLTKERLEKALDRLQEDQVIAGWEYAKWDEAIAEKRKWAEVYLKATILIEAPDNIKGHYQKNIRQLPHKEAPKAGPEPAPRIDGLGEMLRKERLRRKLTQLQVAEILGVTPPRVSQIENGRDNPSAKVQDKIRAWLSEKT